MTTLLVLFAAATALSLILTPAATRIGRRLGAYDQPNARKCHVAPIPRTGGMAIFTAFMLSLLVAMALSTRVSDMLRLDGMTLGFLAGGVLHFGLGLWDDVRRLGNKVKFLVQIAGASAAFAAGLRIEIFTLGGFSLPIAGVVSYGATVFWFLLFTNAINLIDGLDGLASGVAFFCCLAMVFLSVVREDYLTALWFTLLGGSILGFLRYNFNPANVFMGDGGSYFIGYMIAGLAVMGAVKSQVGAVLLIPLVALGVPVMDTLFSPIRRFVRGKAMFSPDRGHIHHRLLDKGLSAQTAVWSIYGASLCFCLLSVGLVNMRHEQAGFFLILIGGLTFVYIRLVGTFRYLNPKTVYSWFRDMADETGIGYERRSFFNHQVEIFEARDFGELWEKLCHALEGLSFDMAEIHFADHLCMPEWVGEGDDRIWTRNGFDRTHDICRDCLFKVELPLMDGHKNNFGTLWLIKDLRSDSISHYTLRRIEHLRRTLVGALEVLGGRGELETVLRRGRRNTG